MAVTMAKIRKLHAEKTPPDGAVAAGVTPDGKQLYRLVTKRTRSVARLDENGQQQWMKHPTTAQQLYPLRRHVPYDHEELFFLESDGQGNIYKQAYSPPTPEQIAEEERQRKIAAMVPSLAGALVDAGMTADQLVASLGRGVAPAAQSVSAEMNTFPQMYAPGRWRLSNGDTMQGTRADAQEAESALNAAGEGF